MSFQTFNGCLSGQAKRTIRICNNQRIYYGSRFMRENNIFKFKDPWVILSYDSDKKRIGFRFSDGEEKYAIKVRSNKRHTYLTFSSAFFKWMHIKHKESRAYRVELDKDGLFYIEIKEDE